MSLRKYITCTVALGAILSSTALVLFAGIAAACSGTGGGGGGCSAPSVSTGSATVNGSNSVTLNGSVNPQGCYTEYAFEYGRSSEGYPDEIIGSAGSGNFPISVSTSSAIVQPGTSYHYRLTAWNSGDEVTGGSGSFTTSPTCTKPTVTTEAASFVTSDKAFLNGKINPNGCSTSYTFEYGLAASGTYTKLTGSISALGPFYVSKEATGLMANKLYTFRLWASNSHGKGEGSWLNFSTKPKYVALGDSYSAGTGTGTNYEPKNSGNCHRTTKAYPYLLHNAHPDWGFVNATCEGAETDDLINLQASSLTQDTTWVTYTVGGNDAGFENVIKACYPSETTNCFQQIATAQGFIKNVLPTLLNNVNNKIKSQASSAKVVVLGYPRVFNGEDCNTFTDFDPLEMQKLNETAEQLSTALRAAATRAGANFTFRDAIPGFGGHAVCDPPGSGEGAEWINGASLPLKESYHPKIEGHANVYYPLVHGVTG
jgi:lysophospholipase L1-like esterase